VRRNFLRGVLVLGASVSNAAGQQPPAIAPPPAVAGPVAYLPTPTPAPPLPSVDPPPELNRVLRDYERAWAAHNPEALSRLFTTDGFVMPNGAPPVRGRQAIRRAYATAGGPLALRALAFGMEGTMGYVVGAYGRSEASGDTGKFILLLQRGKDGRWMIAADIDNSNSRPRAAGPPTPTASPYAPVVPHASLPAAFSPSADAVTSS
jgi:ketosteroid isomerase-like protein